jgi:hypothetical protein
LEGEGTGPIDAFVQALSANVGRNVRVLNYAEHAIGEGANAKAIAYVELRVDDAQVCYGVGWMPISFPPPCAPSSRECSALLSLKRR